MRGRKQNRSQSKKLHEEVSAYAWEKDRLGRYTPGALLTASTTYWTRCGIALAYQMQARNTSDIVRQRQVLKRLGL